MMILFCWCYSCGDRVRVELPPTLSDGEVNALAETFICSRCQKGREDIAAGRVKPTPMPAQRRDDAFGGSVMERMHKVVRRIAEGK